MEHGNLSEAIAKFQDESRLQHRWARCVLETTPPTKGFLARDVADLNYIDNFAAMHYGGMLYKYEIAGGTHCLFINGFKNPDRLKGMSFITYARVVSAS